MLSGYCCAWLTPWSESPKLPARKIIRTMRCNRITYPPVKMFQVGQHKSNDAVGEWLLVDWSTKRPTLLRDAASEYRFRAVPLFCRDDCAQDRVISQHS